MNSLEVEALEPIRGQIVTNKLSEVVQAFLKVVDRVVRNIVHLLVVPDFGIKHKKFRVFFLRLKEGCLLLR